MTTSIMQNLAILIVLVLPFVDSFSVARKSQRYACRINDEQRCLRASRRSIFESVSGSAALILSTVLITDINEAFASGGATAGGVYLLSAKQRYNTRVTSGVISFRSIGSKIESGDIDYIRSFFASEELGNWKDFSTAGYLLANAFRRSSNTPPDSLPSVKKWKAFAAEVENITKSLKKKDNKGAAQAFAVALNALDEFLEKVELPPSKEVTVV